LLAAAAFASNPNAFQPASRLPAHAQGRARIEKQKGFSVNSDAFMVSLIKAL